jgi:DNA-binding IclR family transcriptional regulator
VDRRHGYLLLLELAGPGGMATAVGRGEAARRYGVSPAHVSALLATAEGQGWISRNRGTGLISLDPVFAQRLDIWVARELAIVGLWLQTKLKREQGG